MEKVKVRINELFNCVVNMYWINSICIIFCNFFFLLYFWGVIYWFDGHGGYQGHPSTTNIILKLSGLSEIRDSARTIELVSIDLALKTLALKITQQTPSSRFFDNFFLNFKCIYFKLFDVVVGRGVWIFLIYLKFS